MRTARQDTSAGGAQSFSRNLNIHRYMKRKLLTAIAALAFPALTMAQGWPANHKGVMLQAFYWDSYDATAWTNLEAQADELAEYFNLVWIPQSAWCGGKSMGYDDLYWFNNYNSSFGTEAQLRSMITTFKQKGIGTIADVVINHRKNLSNWVDFPAETYKGTTYQLQSTDICADDDGGQTATWAKANGYSLSTNADTGEGWSGMRDLDHQSANVQTTVKAYLDFLLNDLGYTGFRYDMTKGYASSYTGMYNSAAQPTYSVGEYWDGDKTRVIAWLAGTKVNGNIQSAAFDFPLRYAVRDAINNNNWTKLDAGGLATQNAYKRYAVTFVENHDTERRSATETQDPIKADTLAANAYILAMPGTPCVFLKHWTDCKGDLKNMILVRNMAGITNQSRWARTESSTSRYVVTVTGDNCKLIAALGPGASSYAPASGYTLAAEGRKYRYYVENSLETAWSSLPSGTYYNAPKAKLTAISATSGAQIVYTLDGSTPTASSTRVASGTSVSLPEGSYTMTTGLLVNGAVKGIITRKYNVKTFDKYDITVNVNADKVGWTNLNTWTWGGDGSHGSKSGAWPGDAVTQKVEAAGKTWYTTKWTINSADDYVNFVFNADASTQTVDVSNVKQTSYYVISSETDANGHYLVTDVTEDVVSGIAPVSAQDALPQQPTRVYAADGTTVRSFASHVAEQTATQGLPAGFYIVNGKKIVVK